MIQSRHQLQSTGGCELAASDLSIIWLLRNYCWNEAPPRVRVPRLAKVPAREGGLGNLYSLSMGWAIVQRGDFGRWCRGTEREAEGTVGKETKQRLSFESVPYRYYRLLPVGNGDVCLG